MGALVFASLLSSHMIIINKKQIFYYTLAAASTDEILLPVFPLSKRRSNARTHTQTHHIKRNFIFTQYSLRFFAILYIKWIIAMGWKIFRSTQTHTHTHGYILTMMALLCIHKLAERRRRGKEKLEKRYTVK